MGALPTCMLVYHGRAWSHEAKTGHRIPGTEDTEGLQRLCGCNYQLSDIPTPYLILQMEVSLYNQANLKFNIFLLISPFQVLGLQGPGIPPVVHTKPEL